MNPAGSVTYNVQISTSGLAGQINNVNSQLGGAGGTGAAAFGAKFGAVAGITQSVFNKALSTISGSVDNAVARVDTLNNSNRAFANMGFSATETKKTMDTLVQSIQGLPTPLDGAVNGVELLAGSTGNLSKSGDIFKALNDGILGFGGSATDVQGTIVQLSQAFSNGKVDAQTWNSLIQNGMGPALNALAKQMGMTTGALKDGLSNGTISVQQFQDGLINLDKNGGGGMQSLQKIVKDSTSGMGTNMDNMQTAITRGLASIINAIGSKNIANVIKDIGSAFETALKAVAGMITFLETHKAVADILTALAVGIGAVLIAMQLWNAYVKISTAIQTAWNIVMAANPLGIILLAIIGVTAALIWFFTQTDTGREIFKKFVDFVKGAWDIIKGAIDAVWKWLKENWPLILEILTGPIGIAVVQIVKHWDAIKGAFDAAVKFVKNIWSDIGNWFGDRVNDIKNMFGNIGGWFHDKFTEAIDGIKNIFSGIGNWFGDRVNDIVNAFSGIGGRIGKFFDGLWQGAANGIKNIMNSVLNLPLKIPSISILGHTVGGQTVIPRLATGGIVDSPTTALIGEAGPEAVIPLSQNAPWMDALAKKINGGTGGPTTIIVKLGEETIATKVIDLINNRSMLQGHNAIKV